MTDGWKPIALPTELPVRKGLESETEHRDPMRVGAVRLCLGKPIKQKPCQL